MLYGIIGILVSFDHWDRAELGRFHKAVHRSMCSLPYEKEDVANVTDIVPISIARRYWDDPGLSQ